MEQDDAMTELQRTVPITLMIMGWVAKEPVTFVRLARGMLSARADLLRRILSDVDVDLESQLEAFVDTEPHRILDDAIREIKLNRAQHGKVLSVLSRCIVYRHLHPRRRRLIWVQNYFAVDHSAEKAVRSLRIAVSFSRAAQDAFDIAGTFEARTPPWASWMRKTERFVTSATEATLEAWVEVLKMRQYVRAEFKDAWIILNA